MNTTLAFRIFIANPPIRRQSGERLKQLQKNVTLNLPENFRLLGTEDLTPSLFRYE